MNIDDSRPVKVSRHKFAGTDIAVREIAPGKFELSAESAPNPRSGSDALAVGESFFSPAALNAINLLGKMISTGFAAEVSAPRSENGHFIITIDANASQPRPRVANHPAPSANQIVEPKPYNWVKPQLDAETLDRFIEDANGRIDNSTIAAEALKTIDLLEERRTAATTTARRDRGTARTGLHAMKSSVDAVDNAAGAAVISLVTQGIIVDESLAHAVIETMMETHKNANNSTRNDKASLATAYADAIAAMPEIPEASALGPINGESLRAALQKDIQQALENPPGRRRAG